MSGGDPENSLYRGGDRWGHRRDGWRHHPPPPPPRPRTRLSISIGAHFGGFWSLPPTYVSSPFHYYSYAYCSPSFGYYHRPVYWTPHRWSTSYYYPYWGSYWPRSSLSLVYTSGRGFRAHYSWLFDFRFGHVPVYPVTHCSLVQPATIHYVQPTVFVHPVSVVTTSSVAESGWFGSTNVGTASESQVGVVLPEPQRAQPAPAATPPARLTTGADLGLTYLQLGDAESALRVLGHHLAEYPNDTEAIRGAGLAYLLLGDGENGVRQVAQAYRLSPWLAARPLSEQSMSRDDFAYALDVATHAAAQRPTADAWLTVAVLMQGQERFGAARAAIQRARGAGLDEDVAGRFELVLPADAGQ